MPLSISFSSLLPSFLPSPSLPLSVKKLFTRRLLRGYTKPSSSRFSKCNGDINNKTKKRSKQHLRINKIDESEAKTNSLKRNENFLPMMVGDGSMRVESSIESAKERRRIGGDRW